MRVRYHILASGGISIGLQAAVHSWPATLGCFFSGILIDTDHYLEYFLLRRKFPFRYQDLVDFCKKGKEKKIYLVFHAYEYLFILWLSIYYLHPGMVWLGVAIGLSAHLIIDQFTNPIKPLFYFITYRITHRFEKVKIIPKAYYLRNYK